MSEVPVETSPSPALRTAGGTPKASIGLTGWKSLRDPSSHFPLTPLSPPCCLPGLEGPVMDTPCLTPEGESCPFPFSMAP